MTTLLLYSRPLESNFFSFFFFFILESLEKLQLFPAFQDLGRNEML
jgi:hypothetical protein